jgi:hypothetical protein
LDAAGVILKGLAGPKKSAPDWRDQKRQMLAHMELMEKKKKHGR